MADVNEILAELDRRDQRGELPPEARAILDELKRRQGLTATTTPEPQPTISMTKQAPVGVRELFNLPVSQNLPQEIASTLQRSRETQPGFIETGKRAAIPTALSVAGGAVGGLAGPPGAIAGRAGGSMLGTYLNQKLGLEEPSGAQIALSGGLSVAGDILGSPTVRQKIVRALPGSGAALREYGAQIVEKVPQTVLPTVPSKVIFDKLDELNPTVRVPGLGKVADELAQHEANLAKYNLENVEVARTTKAIAESIKGKSVGKLGGKEYFVQGAGDVDFQTVMAIRRRIGERIGSLRRSTAPNAGEQLGVYKQLFKELSADLDRSEGMTKAATQLLKKANEAAKREFASQQIDDILFETIGKAREGTALNSSNFAQALNKLRKLRRTDDLFEQSIPKGQLDAIEKTLNTLREIKIPPPPRGVNVGSYRAGGRMVGGAAVAQAAGIPWIYGAAATELSYRGVSALVQSEKGRTLVAGLAAAPGGWTNAKLAVLGTFMRAIEAESPEEQP